MDLAGAGLVHYPQARGKSPGEGRDANGEEQSSDENEHVVGHISSLWISDFGF
jgi:hypothetical protein